MSVDIFALVENEDFKGVEAELKQNPKKVNQKDSVSLIHSLLFIIRLNAACFLHLV